MKKEKKKTAIKNPGAEKIYKRKNERKIAHPSNEICIRANLLHIHEFILDIASGE